MRGIWRGCGVLPAVLLVILTRPGHCAVTPPSGGPTAVTNSIEVLGCPSDIFLYTEGPGERSVSWIPPHTPAGAGSDGIISTSTHCPGSFFPVGRTMVSYAFLTGSASLQASCSFEVTLIGDVAPCRLEEPLALGMADGRIPDESITASSIWENNALVCGPLRARPSTTGCAESWCSLFSATAPWIQVDFNIQVYISGLITQGRGDLDQWVTRYQVQYSDDGQSWNDLTYPNGTSMEFVGNVDRHSLVTARFVATLHTRFLRILPTAWDNWCSMRFEILGCYKLDEVK